MELSPLSANSSFSAPQYSSVDEGIDMSNQFQANMSWLSRQLTAHPFVASLSQLYHRLRISNKWTARRRYVIVCMFNTLFSIAAGLTLPYVLENKWMTMPSYLIDDCGLGASAATTLSADENDDMTELCIYRVSLRRGGVALMILFLFLGVGSWFNSRIHNDYWFAKYIGFACLQTVLFTSQFIISSTWMSNLWGWFDCVGRVAGSLWLVVQGIVLLDLSHELHLSLLLNAMRYTQEKLALSATLTHAIHIAASLTILLAVMGGSLYTLRHTIPLQCTSPSNSPAASSTAKTILVSTLLAGLCISALSLVPQTNKGLLIPAITLAYQALIAYSVVTSDLCHVTSIESEWSGRILDLPLESLSSALDSISLAALHCACVYSILTDQSKTMQKLIAAAGEIGNRLSRGSSSVDAVESRGGYHQYTEGSSGVDVVVNLGNEEFDGMPVLPESHVISAESIISGRRPSISPTYGLGRASSPTKLQPRSSALLRGISSPESDDEDDYLFNYRERSGNLSGQNDSGDASVNIEAPRALSATFAHSSTSAVPLFTRSSIPSNITRLKSLRTSPSPFVVSPAYGAPAEESSRQSFEPQYWSFNSTTAGAVLPRPSGTHINEIAFHFLMILASGYVPLLLTNWDSPYGRHSTQHVLVLWPRMIAAGVIWGIYLLCLWSSWTLHTKLQLESRERERTELTVSL